MEKLGITKERLINITNLLLGVMIAAFAFSFFLNPNNIVIGGVSGVGVIVKKWIDPSLVIFLINGCLLIISLIFIGKEFFIKTILGALTFPGFTYLFDLLYQFLNKLLPDTFNFANLDRMLVIIFSSIIMGYGLGLAVKNGGSTGGTEIPQKILYNKCHIPYSASLYIIDGTVIILGFIFLKQNISDILYEIIFVALCGVVMDTTIFSGFNKRAVQIISDKCDKIRDILLEDFERGVTSIKVIGEYSQTDKKMILCVLSTNEYYKLRDLIEEIDPTAFFYCMRASEVRGEGFSYVSK